ncbi:hypothetical protein FX276_21320 [Salmonella enterica]|nr:hypothetical protein [Salmonella enterica]
MTGTASPSLPSAKRYPYQATQEPMYAAGVVTTRHGRSRGVSPRYAGRQGRLRACTRVFQVVSGRRRGSMNCQRLNRGAPRLWRGFRFSG